MARLGSNKYLPLLWQSIDSIRKKQLDKEGSCEQENRD